MRLRANAAQHIESVYFRHHHVQDHQLVVFCQRSFSAGGAAVYRFSFETFLGQKTVNELAQFDVIINDEYSFRARVVCAFH
jgi:hypothetical protein